MAFEQVKPVQGLPGLFRPQTPLAPLFNPRTVAVIGATEKPGSVGRSVLRNLIEQPFGATIFPINPSRRNVLGIRCYQDVAAVGEAIDLAIVVTPAATVPEVLQECVNSGVRSAVVLSAGFAELGAAGKERELKIRALLESSSMRVVGPNCLGLMNPRTGLNATFAQSNALPGKLAFLSQSGALCTAILDWSWRENVGFSGFVSVGSMIDVSWGDLIYHFGDDPYTSSILIYMESIADARSFLSAAREVSLRKPIIVIKPGRTEAARRAAASHTGALTCPDEVFEAAFRRCGILRVSTIAELFDMAEVLSKQPRPQGRRLAVVTNAGGLGVLATDTLLANGGELAQLSDQTMAELNKILPQAWSHANPIDTLGDSGAELYVKALQLAARDPNCDAVLSILAPQAMTAPQESALQLSQAAQRITKPLVASWMGGARMQVAADTLNQAGIPTFDYPDAAARSLAYMWRYSSDLRAIYETPEFAGDLPQDGPRYVARITAPAVAENRVILTEHESKQILEIYGLPLTATTVASSPEEAVKAAETVGYPVVLKLHSRAVTHKFDRGGVHLDIKDAAVVRSAFAAMQSAFQPDGSFDGVTVQHMFKDSGYELILGSSTDPQFGPVMVFGLGGNLVEVLRDQAYALPPLTTTLARRLMERTQILAALKGTRGRKPVNLEALEELLVRFSQLVVENPRIAEVEINPLLASAKEIIALDARVILHAANIKDAELPRPAIRPYPRQYVSRWTSQDGLQFTFRPIRPDDENLMVEFHQQLSENSVYMRFFIPLKLDFRTSHERLFTKCFIDYDREMALVAEYSNENGERRIAGIARLIRQHSNNNAEVAFLVVDKFQNRGLGTQLLSLLIEIARKEGIDGLEGATLSENYGMKDMFVRAGFKFNPPEDGVATAFLSLR